MSSIFIVRHQAYGFVHEYPFAKEPTAEQLAAVERLCLQSCGVNHPKTGEKHWVKVVEVPLLGAKDVPEVPERALSLSKENKADAGEMVASAVGHVTNPGER
jgi:hypothetical protein